HAFRAWRRSQLVRCYICGGRAGIEPCNAQSRLQAFVDTAVGGIITLGGLGNVKAFSRSVERLWGCVNKCSRCGCAGRMAEPDVQAARLSHHITRYFGSAPAFAQLAP